MEGGWSTPRPGRFTPGKDPIPLVKEAGCAPGPIWTGAENLAHTGIRNPDSPARRESLYQLSYPGPRSGYGGEEKKFLPVPGIKPKYLWTSIGFGLPRATGSGQQDGHKED